MHIAANWHGVRPSALGLCEPDEDFSHMAAYTLTIETMRAWEELQHRKQMELERRRAGRNTPRPRAARGRH